MRLRRASCFGRQNQFNWCFISVSRHFWPSSKAFGIFRGGDAKNRKVEPSRTLKSRKKSRRYISDRRPPKKLIISLNANMLKERYKTNGRKNRTKPKHQAYKSKHLPVTQKCFEKHQKQCFTNCPKVSQTNTPVRYRHPLIIIKK